MVCIVFEADMGIKVASNPLWSGIRFLDGFPSLLASKCQFLSPKRMFWLFDRAKLACYFCTAVAIVMLAPAPYMAADWPFLPRRDMPNKWALWRGGGECSSCKLGSKWKCQHVEWNGDGGLDRE